MSFGPPSRVPSGFPSVPAGRWVVSAPGRVNLIGEHVDYNDGFVLPAAIDRRVTMAADRREDRLIRIQTEDGLETEMSAETKPERGDPPWANHLRGVLAGYLDAGAKIPGLDVRVWSTVPVGRGLSSSAALQVAFATLLENSSGLAPGSARKAMICREAEHDYAGVPCGIMDQFASVNGRTDHAMLLDCRTQRVEHIPLDPQRVTLIIFDTGIPHQQPGAYAQRKAECGEAVRKLGIPSLRDVAMSRLSGLSRSLSPTLARRARHVVTEIARTISAAEAMKGQDWSLAGHLMYDSHASLRDDYEVSCPELDFVVAAAGEMNEIYGCRMTGSGFGGCCVALVKAIAAESVAEKLAAAWRGRYQTEPAVFPAMPSHGARLEK